MNHCTPRKNEDAVRGEVRAVYTSIAQGERQGCCAAKQSCCGGGSSSEAMATALGYGRDELANLPAGANMGLSCGNPTAVAALKSGEVVLDLGAGGGFDVFIAAHKVGAAGLSMGVDMTPEMVSKARRNADAFEKQTGLANVEFRLGEIEHLPVADNSVDVVISNCVVNLSPDKPQVWRELCRVLKPGGRVAVSDMALLAPLPSSVRESVEALVGCVAGAVLVEETQAMAEAAGLVNVQCHAKTDAVDAMNDSSDSLYKGVRDALPPGKKIGDYVTSLYVCAEKPSGCCCA